jgi:single-strand DNA-binding protein
MAGWAQTIIVGNVGRDPVARTTQAGKSVCDFSVAVTRKFGSGDQRQERTVWYRVTCWEQLADIAVSYVRKGGQVMIVGTVEASAYLDKQGQPAASLDLTASALQLLGARTDSADPRDGVGDFPPVPDTMGEIPF